MTAWHTPSDNPSDAPSAEPLEEPAALLAEWRRVTAEGLNASRAQCLAHALAWHQQALQIAHHLFHHVSSGIADDDRLAAFIVAHINLADCYAALGECNDAVDCLCCAHHQLLSLVASDSTPEPMRMAAYRHLRESQAAMNEFCAEHGDHPLMEQARLRQRAMQGAHLASTTLH